MIRHVVLFSAREPEHIDTIVSTLSGYRRIPGVETLDVARTIRRDPWSSEIDVVLDATFADEAALAAYKRHPIYEAGTRTVRPLRELRFVADYVVPDAERRAAKARRRDEAVPA